MGTTCRITAYHRDILHHLFFINLWNWHFHFRFNFRPERRVVCAFCLASPIIAYIAKGYFCKASVVILSAFLIAGLYYLAVEINKRFGLYEAAGQ